MIKDNKKLNSKKGFTLVEVIVAMGVFVIIMGGSAGVFASAFKSYRGAKNTNESLKDAQYAMNLMSKTFRTSSVKHATDDTVIVYDYSQSVCVRYQFSASALRKSTAGVTEPNCNNSASFAAAVPMTIGTVTGVFSASDSDGDDGSVTSVRVGRVTVTMEVTNSAGTNPSSARIQSTSSLRDYKVSNIGIDTNNDPN